MSSIILTAVMSAQLLSCEVVSHHILVHLPSSLSRDIKYMAVVHAGEWRNIVDDRAKLAAFPAASLDLSIKTQKALEYRLGRDVQVLAFPKPGRYKLVFTDNLETEPEEMNSVTCAFIVPR